jgi:pimeloyl-ACP methyl ester carboxylesterase
MLLRMFDHLGDAVPVGQSPVVFLHGAWHGAWCWNDVAPEVAATGRPAVAVDMAGHGLRASRPQCLSARPYDLASVATEPSPVKDVDLDAAGTLLVSQLERIGQGKPVTVVAHSMAGTVLTRAAQTAPRLVAHALYLTAYMPASDVPAAAYAQMPENSGELMSAAIRADPAVIGAMRIDVASGDADYRQMLRDALYGDVDPTVTDAVLALLTPDTPAGIVLGSTHLTADGWGSVPRTYVVCERDMALRPAMQRKFVADANAAFPDNPTRVVSLDSSHSPFLSMPAAVAEVVAASG